MNAPNLSACGAIVRRHDKDSFLCCLFAPVEHREALFSLHAFNHEIAKVRDVVSEPTLGLIRLQWWRESVEAIGRDENEPHEVLGPLSETLFRYGLHKDGLYQLIEARGREIESETRFSEAELLDYADETAGTLARLDAQILGLLDPETIAAVTSVAVARALVGIVRATAFLASDGAMMLPDDGARLDQVALQALKDHDGLREVCRSLCERAEQLLSEARENPGKQKKQALPLLMTATITDLHISDMRKAAFNPFDPSLARERPLLVLRLYWAAFSGRF